MRRIIGTLLPWILVPFVVGILGGFFGWRLAQGSEVDRPTVAEPGKIPNSTTQQDVESPAEVAIPSEATALAPDPSSRLGQLERICGTSLEDLPDLTRELLVEEINFRMFHVLLDRWIELDAEAGYQFFANELDHAAVSGRYQSAVSQYCGRWARVDPDSAVGAAEKSGQQRAIAIQRISESLARERPEDYFRIFPSLISETSTGGIAMAARALAVSDPSAAVAMLGTMASESGKARGIVTEIASGWAKGDPEGALAWVRTLGDGTEQKRALQAVAARLLESEPDRAAALYEESSKMEGSGGASYSSRHDWEVAIRKLGGTDPAAAIKWTAEHYPDEAGNLVRDFLPQDAVAAVVSLVDLPGGVLKEGKLPGWPTENWRPLELEAAISQLDRIADPVKRESIHTWLLGAQAITDPGTAITSATEELSDPSNRAHVFKQGMASWALEDITSASEWLATRPPGAETDGAISSLIGVAKFVEPDSALSWAAEMNDADARVSQLASVFRVWKSVDEKAAREALAVVPLNDEDRSNLKARGIDLQE